MNLKNKNHLLKIACACIVLIAIFLFISHPAYHGGLFRSHDDVQVARIQAMASELKSGQFPVRYVNEFGNGGGYFLFNFYSPLIYYLGAVLHIFGLSAIATTKVLNLFFLIIGALGIFVLLRSKASLSSSIIGTVIFLISPYIFHDFFHRGALAEASAMMLIPWVLWFFLQTQEKKEKMFFIGASVCFALVILTHTLTGALLGGVLFILSFNIKSKKNKTNLLRYYGAIIIGIGLSSFYFFPALLENKHTIYNQVDFVQNGYRNQFIALANQAGSLEAISENKPFLGLPLIIGLILIAVFAFSKQKNNQKTLLKLLFFTSIAGIFIASSYSAFLWANIDHLRFIQFPYRVLTFLVCIISLGLSISLDLVSKKIKIIFGLICVISLIFYWPYYKATGYQYASHYQAEGPCKTTAWNNEHLPIWVKKCTNEKIALLTTDKASKPIKTQGLNIENGGRKISFIITEKVNQVTVNRYYFPGWTAHIEKEKIEIFPLTDYGLITFDLSEEAIGKTITIELQKTNIQLVSEYLSLLTISLIILYIFKYKHELFQK